MTSYEIHNLVKKSGFKVQVIKKYDPQFLFFNKIQDLNDFWHKKNSLWNSNFVHLARKLKSLAKDPRTPIYNWWGCLIF